MPKAFIQNEVGPIQASFRLDWRDAFAWQNGWRVVSLWAQWNARKRFRRIAAEVVRQLKAERVESPSLPVDSAQSLLMERLWRRLEKEKAGDTPHALPSLVEQEISRMAAESAFVSLTRAEWDQLRTAATHQMEGWGPLQPLMEDHSHGDILVNGPGRIFQEKNGVLEMWKGTFQSQHQLRVLADRMLAKAGRRVDALHPMADARLPDGSRLNVIVPPVALEGPIITIRRFRAHHFSLEELIRCGTLAAGDAQTLRQAVLNRSNILVAGNSGAGKTTLLNVLSDFIDPTERIITLEDAAELHLRQPHVVRLETRPANAEGAGEITMSDLVINALRMRPDRLIVGECRGPEVIAMLQAMNTGHDGCLTTLHANSASEAIERLESMVLLGASNWDAASVRRQIHSALDVIVFVQRVGSERKVKDILTLKKDVLPEVSR